MYITIFSVCVVLFLIFIFLFGKQKGIPILIFILLSGMSSGLFHYLNYKSMYSKEIRNFYIVSAKHTEKYSKKEQRSRQVYVGKDKKGNARYRTEYYYVTEYYGPYWTSVDNVGESHNIEESEYNKYQNIWKSEKKVGFIKGSSTLLAKNMDANVYEIYYNKKLEDTFVYSDTFTYENRIRGSHSIFKSVCNPKILETYKRPADVSDFNPVHVFKSNFKDEVDILRKLNAHLGVSKQIHIMYYIFDSKTPRIISDEIVKAWNGVNKNELVIFIGASDKVEWCEVKSWMDNTTIHYDVSSKLIGQVLSVELLKNTIESSIKHWKRKDFKDFEYIKIPIDYSYIFFCFFLNVLFGISLIFIDRNYKFELF